MFVMQHCGMTWEEALHMVQNRRYCISPNGGFLTQIKVRFNCVRCRLPSPDSYRHCYLTNVSAINAHFATQEYESIYKAMQAIQNRPPTMSNGVARRKREDDDDDDETALRRVEVSRRD